MTKFLAAAALGLATLLVGSTTAQAGFIITPNSVFAEGSNWRWNYTAQITTTDTIGVGDFFRIYDFFGYVPGSITAPAGWFAETALSNPTPPPNVLLNLGDDPAITNLIFTRAGAVIPGPATIIGFSALSTSRTSRQKNFVGLNSSTVGLVNSIGEVAVPTAAPVPEPASMILTGLGIGLMGRTYARRRKASA